MISGNSSLPNLMSSALSARIEGIAQLETLYVLLFLALLAWAFYKIFLRALIPYRHGLLRRLFTNLSLHGLAVVSLFVIYRTLFSVIERDVPSIAPLALRIYPYIGLVCIFSGSVFFIKLARIFAFEYLFLLSMKVGVPVLLVNILSLGLSLGLSGWIATEVFGVRLAPVLATSALISVILGLAIQDTLGNLFAGVALQMDKPYELGDWVEVQNSGQKWVGRVEEVSWRSTMLLGFLDEQITIPNRVIASSQVAAYGSHGKPFWKRMDFHIPLNAPFEKAKQTILDAALGVPGLKNLPPPQIYFNEVGDSWINLRLLIALTDFGNQIGITDQVNTAVFLALARTGLQVTAPSTRVEIQNTASTPSLRS